MRVCLVVEGAYPYLTGGVSSWVQQMISCMPDTEFVVQALCADRDATLKMRYQPPENVVEIRNIYLADNDYVQKRSRRLRLRKQHTDMLRDLLFGEAVDWSLLFSFFHEQQPSLNALLSGVSFLEVVQEYYEAHFPQVVFTDFLWTMRSMYMPVFQSLGCQTVKADLYHAVSTGYAGVLGSYQSDLYKAPLILSEHGIYTREREEEIIRAQWVRGIYKDLWIKQFHKISACSYRYAAAVTSLFENARELQLELGCPREKTLVIPNGVRIARYQGHPGHPQDGRVHIGALLRVTPIKDVKTMISAFAIARAQNPALKLWIMGPLDENPVYAQECRALVASAGVEDVVFTGPVDAAKYIAKMDFMVLTSLSEGQPLTILEGFAAEKPCIVTNVGSCRELVEGSGEHRESAGIVTPPMDPEATANAMLRLAADSALRAQMGAAGLRRVQKNHSEAEILARFQDIYHHFARMA